MVRLQDSTACRSSGDDAVGDATVLHGGQEFVDDFVPGSCGSQCVSIVIGNDLDVALAERYEQQNPVRLSRSRKRVRVEFAMCQLLRASMLDALRYESQPDWTPVKYEGQRNCERQLDQDQRAAGNSGTIQAGDRADENRRDRCERERVERIAIAGARDDDT